MPTINPTALLKLARDLARAAAILHLSSGRCSDETRKAIHELYGPKPPAVGR